MLDNRSKNGVIVIRRRMILISIVQILNEAVNVSLNAQTQRGKESFLTQLGMNIRSYLVLKCWFSEPIFPATFISKCGSNRFFKLFVLDRNSWYHINMKKYPKKYIKKHAKNVNINLRHSLTTQYKITPVWLTCHLIQRIILTLST